MQLSNNSEPQCPVYVLVPALRAARTGSELGRNFKGVAIALRALRKALRWVWKKFLILLPKRVAAHVAVDVNEESESDEEALDMKLAEAEGKNQGEEEDEEEEEEEGVADSEGG